MHQRSFLTSDVWGGHVCQSFHFHLFRLFIFQVIAGCLKFCTQRCGEIDKSLRYGSLQRVFFGCCWKVFFSPNSFSYRGFWKWLIFFSDAVFLVHAVFFLRNFQKDGDNNDQFLFFDVSHELPEAIHGGVSTFSQENERLDRGAMIVVADPWYLGKQKLGIDGECEKSWHILNSREKTISGWGVLLFCESFLSWVVRFWRRSFFSNFCFCFSFLCNSVEVEKSMTNNHKLS